MNRLFLIGGGEIRSFETIDIDNTIVSFTKELFRGKERLESLFVPLASHDSKPYFNTFRKMYQSRLKTHADVAIIARGEMDKEHILSKIQKSDIIYFGGGNTRYLIQKLKEYDLDGDFINAYLNGKVMVGLSAGMNIWFENFLSDSDRMEGLSDDYVILKGLGVIKGVCCPHYDTGYGDSFDEYVIKNYQVERTYLAVENNCAVALEDGIIKYCFGKGNAYLLKAIDGKIEKNPIEKIDVIPFKE